MVVAHFINLNKYYMMKKLLIIILLLSVTLFAFNAERIYGYFTQRQLAGAVTQWYLSDSPGNSVGNSKLVVETKDSTYYNMYFENFGLTKYGSTRNDGTPTSILWADASGNIKRSPFTSPVSYTAGTGISLASNIVTNTSPDQTVSLTGANGITTSGTYPIFTISRKKQETFTGTTAGSGTYTVTYSVPYSVEPNVMISQRGGTPTNTLVLSSSSTTGFTVTANNRVEVLGLLPTYPTLNGAVVNVTVTEK